jgi:hypothetical protein
MIRHINEDGVPLRGDGTPFPADPAEWTPEELAYLRTYYFTAQPQSVIDDEQVATVDVPPIGDDGTPFR